MINDSDLLAFDLETTGIDRSKARIVQIYWHLMAIRDGLVATVDEDKSLINPGIPIPAGASEVHKIYDADVADAPSFTEYAGDFYRRTFDRPRTVPLALTGYNLRSYDCPVLENEFNRVWGAESNIVLTGYPIYDVKEIFFRENPRTLEACAEQYLEENAREQIAASYGGEDGAYHDASVDTMISTACLFKQLEAHGDIPADPRQINDYLKNDPRQIDADGKFIFNEDGEAVLNFSKKFKGRTLEWVAINEPGFLAWMTRNDFSNENKRIAQKALNGEFPEPPVDFDEKKK